MASESKLQNPIAKKYKHFYRADQITPQLKHRLNSKCSKRITIEQFFQVSVFIDIRSTKESIFEQKNLKIIPFMVKSSLKSKCERFRQRAIRENFNPKSKTQHKELHSNNGSIFTHQNSEVKGKL